MGGACRFGCLLCVFIGMHRVFSLHFYFIYLFVLFVFLSVVIVVLCDFLLLLVAVLVALVLRVVACRAGFVLLLVHTLIRLCLYGLAVFFFVALCYIAPVLMSLLFVFTCRFYYLMFTVVLHAVLVSCLFFLVCLYVI